MLDFIKRSGTMIIVSGLISILFGLLATFSPISTIFALVVLWGVYAIADGVLALIAAFRPAGQRAKGWLILLGIIGIVAGLFVIFQPFASTVAFVWILATWLILRGIVSVLSAFAPVTVGSRWMIGLVGVLFIIAGVVFLVNPGSAALGFTVFLGIFALAWGIFQVITGIRIRKEAARYESPALWGGHWTTTARRPVRCS